MNKIKVVTVFGSSQARAGDKEYEQAERLGRLLAEAGMVVCNGGYTGSMEASAKGAHHAGGQAIGVTSDVFPARTPNPYLTDERCRPTLLTRIEELVQAADAYIVLPGGIGTLAELLIVWNLLVIENLPSRPVILVGDHYTRILECFRQETEVQARHVACLQVVSTVEQAVARLKNLEEN